MGKAGGKQPAAIAARGRIVDPDNPPSAVATVAERPRRKPQRKACARTDVTGQRASHFVQSAAGKPALDNAVDRNRAQGQGRCCSFIGHSMKPTCGQAARGLSLTVSPSMGIQNIRRGPQSRKVHVAPKCSCYVLFNTESGARVNRVILERDEP